ncbi:MAG: molybdate ABC transporter substrate-binding protein [Spirochaetaceae bacterium]|nr:MAG: molybdate ABC transporter substrate-binding protein [Spirochaetaceae bacterium]
MKRSCLIPVLAALLFLVRIPAHADTVAVAAGLFPCVRELADLYGECNGKAPNLVVGSSGKLASQIAAGAPFGLFLSANREWIIFLEKKGLVVEYTDFATSPLVLWWPRKDPPDPRALGGDLRIAIVDPILGPFGATARAYLEDAGLYDSLLREKRLIVASTALQAALAAQSGAADLAFTSMSVARKFSTDLRAQGSSLALCGYDLTHAGALIRGQATAGVEEFWRYLRSREAVAVWRKWGFNVDREEE